MAGAYGSEFPQKVLKRTKNLFVDYFMLSSNPLKKKLQNVHTRKLILISEENTELLACNIFWIKFLELIKQIWNQHKMLHF
jgi:hypothetical protein